MDPYTGPSVDETYNQLNATYDPLRVVNDQQQAAASANYNTQTTALDQAKVNAFKDITSQANSRGVLFSGVPIDQQATYLGTKYLPARANLETSLNNTLTSLKAANLDIGTRQRAEAQNQVSSAQKAAQDLYFKNANLLLAQQRNQISASRAVKTPAPLTQTQVVSAIRGELGKVTGKDGFVAPQDFAQAYKDFAGAGYNPTDFYKYFQGLMNPNNPYYDYAIKQMGV